MKEGELWHLTATGVGGHASLPEGTVNAIGVLVDYILDNGIAAAEEKRFYELVSLLNNDWTGAALNVAADDGLFEPLTIVGGVIGIEDGHVFQTIDSRYPTNMERVEDRPRHPAHGGRRGGDNDRARRGAVLHGSG